MAFETLVIISIYFLIGGIATIIINRRKPGPEAKQRWIKYFSYVVIVYGFIAIINYGLLFYAGIAISIIGLYEIFSVWLRSQRSVKVISIAAPVYVLLAAAFIDFTSLVKNGALELYIGVLTFDGFSQISGQLFGKRKLAPKVSPGKTVEGVIGGLVFTYATVFLFIPPSKDDPLYWAFITVILCGAALGGDLLASWYKRICGVKDYSNLIPGHGGVLDRFDSYIGVMVFCWAALILTLKWIKI